MYFMERWKPSDGNPLFTHIKTHPHFPFTVEELTHLLLVLWLVSCHNEFYKATCLVCGTLFLVRHQPSRCCEIIILK